MAVKSSAPIWPFCHSISLVEGGGGLNDWDSKVQQNLSTFRKLALYLFGLLSQPVAGWWSVSHWISLHSSGATVAVQSANRSIRVDLYNKSLTD